jgi:arylsulfatase A-like enzyme
MRIHYIIKVTAIAAFLFHNNLAFPTQPQKPNILVIMTDQQFADAMSCVMGNQYLKTPNMDKLAENGVRFTRAYSPNPLCVPMRSSMMTGRFPHQTGVLSNDEVQIDAKQNVFLGKLFKEAGYETAYFGKWHVAFDERQNIVHGFDVVKDAEGRLNPNPAAVFLKQKHDKPFIAVASFLSPHEICEWSRKQDLPGGPLKSEIPAMENLPPLKSNFNPPQNETDIMTFMRKSYQAHRLFPVGDYTEYDWRRLAWGYYRLIERADDFVGEIMNALKETGQENNTLIVFLSDHGECCGSHHWNQKTVFYDESSRVPLIMSWKGKTAQGTSNILLNTGTDIIPTLCDFAQINIPDYLP